MIEVAALDHVHLYVADPHAAADWYGRILGLRVLPSSARKVDALYMATAKGPYCATIFTGMPPSDGDHTTAFRVSGPAFLSFADQLPNSDVAGRDGRLLERGDADDHGLAWSYYFKDPDGNHLEVTTYDHAAVRAVLGAKNGDGPE